MNIHMERAAILKLFRERAGLTKSEVAKETGLTLATITNYENGYTQPSPDTLAILTKLYGEEFTYAMNMLYYENKKAYINFRDSKYDNSESGLPFEEKHYPILTKVKAYLAELDKNKKS